MRADLKSTQQPVSDEFVRDKVKVSVEGDAEKDVDLLTLEDIRDQIRYIEKAVTTKELHFMTRVLRGIVPISRKLNSNVLRGLVHAFFSPQSQQWNYFMEFLPEAMDAPQKLNVKPKTQKPVGLFPEVEVYLHLLLLIYLLDSGKTKEATQCSGLLMDRTQETGRRTMAVLASRCFYYHSRAFELDDRLEDIRPFLHSRLRSATLKNNHDCQAVLINLLLRNYLHYNLHDQASKLVNCVEFPESAPNNEWARFLYYLGFIKAIQLDYNAAHDHLVSAHRKAPQQTAVGFKQALHKLNTVVELLLGELPDRSIFRQQDLKDALHPYFQTDSIDPCRVTWGQFNHVLKTYVQQFNHDKTYTLILRLRHNVIKTGVRRISLSYSKIYLMDVAEKLQLDSSEDAEYIVAKAIRDGVIEAVIKREQGYMITTEASDLYSTREPMDQFNQRIRFCLGIRNQAIKAMRYPPKQYSKDLESAEERREREQQEMESAKELSEDDFDGFP